jgi:hypothetical protein
MSDNDNEKEWERIMDNPDNVMMSEALISKVDPYDLGDIEPTMHVSVDCEITFAGYSIVGTILGFHTVDGVTSYTALVPVTEAFRLLGTSPISSIKIYSLEKTFLVNEYPDDTRFDFEVEVQDGENAVLTISFPTST